MEPSIAPLAKRLAEENNVPWQHIAGSGADGRIVERDVLEYLSRVMAGDEAIDPTPEPLPQGMEAWPEEDVKAYYEKRGMERPSELSGSDDSDDMLEFGHEDFGMDFDNDPLEVSSSVVPDGRQNAQDTQDDIFIFDEEEAINLDEDFAAEFSSEASEADAVADASDVQSAADSFIEPSGWDNLKADNPVEDLFAAEGEDDLFEDDVGDIFVDDNASSSDFIAADSSEVQAQTEESEDSFISEDFEVDIDDLDTELIIDNASDAALLEAEGSGDVFSEENYQPDPILDELIPNVAGAPETQDMQDMDWEASEADTASFELVSEAVDLVEPDQMIESETLEPEPFVYEYNASDGLDEMVSDAAMSDIAQYDDSGTEAVDYEVVMSSDYGRDDVQPDGLVDVGIDEAPSLADVQQAEQQVDENMAAELSLDSHGEDQLLADAAKLDEPVDQLEETIDDTPDAMMVEEGDQPANMLNEVALEADEVSVEIADVQVFTEQTGEPVADIPADEALVETAAASDDVLLQEEAQIGLESSEPEVNTENSVTSDPEEEAASTDVAVTEGPVDESLSLNETEKTVMPDVPTAPLIVPGSTSATVGAQSHYGLVLRRHLDLTALVQAHESLAQELGQSSAEVMQALLLNAAKKAHRTAALNEKGRIGLARMQEKQIEILIPAKAKTFADLLQGINKVKPTDKPVALLVMDFSQSDIDEIELHISVPVLTLGRVAYDERDASYHSTLTLAGDVSIEAGSKFMAAMVDLLNAPVRLVV